MGCAFRSTASRSPQYPNAAHDLAEKGIPETSMNDAKPPSPELPVIEKHRIEAIRRSLTMASVQPLSPRMLRVTLRGDELAGFRSPSPDDHIKVFFPTPEGGSQERDNTPRHFDADAGLLTVDFALHEGGMGAAWALHAKPGDPVQIGGPRGSKVISAPNAWWILIGDETAIPAIERRLEEMASDTQVIAIFAVTGPEEELPFETKAKLTTHWIHRSETEASDPEPFLKLLSQLQLPPFPGFVWIGAETEVSRAVRSYFIETLGHGPEWIKASAYWSKSS
jgi:NADPH-dependent ferric siderophore reductase